MTKVITVAIIVVVLFGGWQLFLYWEKVKNEEETAKKQAVAAEITPQSLPGLPYPLEESLAAAQRQGATGLTNWLKTYGLSVQDPRKAYIELDYCLALTRENPAEARRIFAAVKERIPPSSPLWPRIKNLEKTYQ